MFIGQITTYENNCILTDCTKNQTELSCNHKIKHRGSKLLCYHWLWKIKITG